MNEIKNYTVTYQDSVGINAKSKNEAIEIFERDYQGVEIISIH